jgi:DNA ligase 1
MNHETLYKKDSLGKIRVWWIESDEEKYRTHAGILDGKIVTSGWIYPEKKNVGKANETSVAQQVLLEVASEYEKKTNQGKYHISISETEEGANFFEPMLAQKFDPKKNKEYPFFSQPKMDGLRCLVSRDVMQSRNGKTFVSSPHIQEALAEFFEENPDVVLDGEIYNHELKNNFEKIVSLARKTKPTEEDIEESSNLIEYHVYDVITPEKMNFSARIEFLRNGLINISPFIKVVKTSVVHNLEEVNAKMAEYISMGYEGQMLRVDGVPYEHKRSKSLIKHKEFDDGEFTLAGIVEGIGNWAGMAKAAIIILEDGRSQESGMRGNFTDAKEIFENKESLYGTKVTVRYQGRTSDGKLRFPIVTHFWKGERDV